MVIRVYQSQIRADKRPTVSGSPSINTGASEFYASLADTISRTGNELGEFFIKKKEKELTLEAEIENGSINQELTDLYNSYLDPENEIYLSPEKWVEGDESFQSKAQTILNNKTKSIQNKFVADTVKAKFQENYLSLEKDLTKESFKRTDALLESNLDLRKTTLIDDISKNTDGMGVSILVDELSDVIIKQVRGGYISQGETLESVYSDAMQQIATNRIANASNNLTMSELNEAFQGREFIGDPITTLAFSVLSDEQINEISDNAVDLKIKDIERIIEIDEKADQFFKVENENEFVELENTKDPSERSAIYESLKEKAQGDASTLQIIEKAYKNDIHPDVSQNNPKSISKDIFFGKVSYDDLVEYKDDLSETDYNKLHDDWVTINKPNSPLVSEFQKAITDMFYTENDEILKAMVQDNAAVADIIMLASNKFLNKFNNNVKNLQDSQSIRDLFDAVETEANAFIFNEKTKSIKKYLNEEIIKPYQDFAKLSQENLIEDLEKIKKDPNVDNNRKNFLQDDIDTMILLFGQDVFNEVYQKNVRRNNWLFFKCNRRKH